MHGLAILVKISQNGYNNAGDFISQMKMEGSIWEV